VARATDAAASNHSVRSENGRILSHEAIDFDVESGEELLHGLLVDRRGRRHLQDDALPGVRIDDVGQSDQGLTDLGGAARSRKRLGPEDPRGRRPRATLATEAVERQIVLFEQFHESLLVEPLAWLQGESRSGPVLKESVDVLDVLEGRTGHRDGASATACRLDDIDGHQSLARRIERAELDARG